MAKDPSKLFTVSFVKDKDTKSTVRFQEETGEDAPKIGTLYVQKHALNQLGNPTAVSVTVEAK